MPIGPASRRFLLAAPIHLLAWGLLTAVGPSVAPWDATLWLLMTGFVGQTIVGFLLHLAPGLLGRPLGSTGGLRGVFGLSEAAVVAGTWGLAGGPPAAAAGALTLAGALLWLSTAAVLVGRTVATARAPAPVTGAGRPAARPSDQTVVPLLGASLAWLLGAALLWVLSALLVGPGLGFFVAGVHLFLVGHAATLVFAVGLRLLPRALGADPPRILGALLVPTASAGPGFLVVGLLGTSVWGLGSIALWALPEAVAGLTFLLTVVALVQRSTTPKPTRLAFLASVLGLAFGGLVGLAMVGSSDFLLRTLHADAMVLGFLGAMIVGMVASLLAPFQRIGHRWTVTALRVQTVLLFAAVAALGTVDLVGAGTAVALRVGGGACAAAVGAIGAAGTGPVLYPGRG